MEKEIKEYKEAVFNKRISEFKKMSKVDLIIGIIDSKRIIRNELNKKELELELEKKYNKLVKQKIKQKENLKRKQKENLKRKVYNKLVKEETKPIKIRYSPEDYKKLQEKADSLHLKIRTYIIMVSLNTNIKMETNIKKNEKII